MKFANFHAVPGSERPAVEVRNRGTGLVVFSGGVEVGNKMLYLSLVSLDLLTGRRSLAYSMRWPLLDHPYNYSEWSEAQKAAMKVRILEDIYYKGAGWLIGEQALSDWIEALK